MGKAILSKSTYIRSLQCLKSLYLNKYHYDQRDKLSREQQAKFSRGHSVGKLAQQLFPGGIDASISARQKSLQAQLKTYELIQQGNQIIYEASFVFEDVWVIADVIVKTENGWKVYEVKSSAALSDTYMNDAALQYYVISNSMLQLMQQPVIDFSLVYVNRLYVREEKIDLNKMFLTSSVISFCREQQPLVLSRITKARDVLENGKVPAVETGEHCFNPYPCDFTGTCWKNQTLPHVRITEIDLEKVHAFFEATENYYVFDFLQHRAATPLFTKTRPYQRLIFQINIACYETAIQLSYSATADSGADPNESMIQFMLSQLNKPYPVLVTNHTSKINALIELAEFYPQHKTALQNLSERLINVFDFFKEADSVVQSNDHLLKVMKIKKPFVKSTVFDDISAISAFEKMQQQVDLFGNEDLKNSIDKYATGNLKLLINAIELLKLK